MKTGRKAFGTTPAEQEIVSLIKLKGRVRKGGLRPSLSSIAHDLNAAGLRTQTGKPWRPQTVKNVLENNSKPDSGQTAKAIKKTSLDTDDYLSRTQLGQLFKAARAGGPVDEMLIAVLVGSGLRASELCSLQVRDLGITAGKSQIDVRRGKGAKQRSVFISAELGKSLGGYLAGLNLPRKAPVFANRFGEPLTYEALYKRIKKIGELAGLPNLHPHTLRHTFGTLLYHYQKDLFFVKEQLGHSKVDTTQIYAKTLTESKLEQMKSMGTELSGLLNHTAITDNTSKTEREQ